MRNGLILALVQTLLAGAVAMKFYYDRQTLPRVWTRAVPIDPVLPIRGRYVRLQVEVQFAQPPQDPTAVRIFVSDGKLMAEPAQQGLWIMKAASAAWVLSEPLAYFIPENAPDPSARAAGEELWVEVSVPPAGPPRPVRLGVKRQNTVTPLAARL